MHPLTKRLPLAAIAAVVLLVGGVPAGADLSPQPLPFGQDWSDTGLISVDDDWSGVPGVTGYRGDDLTTATGTDPQTITADGSGTPVDVIANQTSPNTLATGGVAEFQLANPVVALQGSGTADAPQLVFTLNTTGFSDIHVSYNLRDIDGSTDNAVQPVALQYRLGATGGYTNVPAAFVADASQGPSLSGLVTTVDVFLPAVVSNQPTVQLRVLTTNAVGNDEWIGVDDMSVTGTTNPTDEAPTVQSTTPSDGDSNVGVGASVAVNFSEPVTVTDGWYTIACSSSGAHTATVTGGPVGFTIDPDTNFANSESCTVTVVASHVTDQDTTDPPDAMAGDHSFSFTTAGAAPLVVISQVYGGGGNAGATLKNDFIELFNRGASPVSLNGWSVQYASAAGTGWTPTNLTGVTLQPGHYYLVQEAPGAGGSVDLPAPDASGSIAMAAGAGKVALVTTTSALSGSCPSSGSIVDLVGYGAASCFEGGGPAPTLTNTTAALRAAGGCVDTNNNAADFAGGSPTPRNTLAPAHVCNGPTGVGAANPSSLPPGDSTLLTVAVTPGTSPTSTGLAVSCDLGSIGGASGQPFFDDGSNGDVTAGDNTFSYATSVTVGTSPGAKTLSCTVSDAEARANPTSITLTVEGAATPIHTIQGAAHISSLLGQTISTHGIVTASTTNGFWMQDATPDADPATSEGIFVFTSSAPTASVGQSVRVSATVQEFRPGGAANGNLTTTELGSPSVTVLSSGNALPDPVVMGTGGRIPPDTVIEDDATGSVETSGVFDPDTDGLDFYESLEGMRVQLDNAVAVGPTETDFGETPVIGDDGANASVRTSRGGILLRPNDGNPERVTLDDVLTPLPNVNVGDHYSGPIVGIMDYNFGNPFLNATTAGVTAIHDGVTRESSDPVTPGQLAVSTFNFENLAATNAQSKFDSLASLIVNNLRSPDLLSGEEVQDNNGAASDGTVDASQTLTRLVNAIVAAGGPTYQWREIDPVDGQDGGEPGGNIRQVFLFRTDRGLSFVDRPGGGSTTPNAVTGSGNSTQLLYSPGRIDPTDSAFDASRKPLAGEFTYRGHKLFAIVNHFNSKGGDDPLRGRFQPPTRFSEAQRHQQAQIVNDFVDSILAGDPSANVVVLGDLNDFEFSDTVSILEGGVLHDLMDTLPLPERYSYEFEGNAQVLDHILFSGSLFARPFVFDPVHVNAEFFDQASDHDPSVVRVALNEAPTVEAGGPYSAAEGGSVGLAATGNDAEGGTLTYAWDLDSNGTYETAGQTPTFSAATLDGPSTRTVGVQVTDDVGQTGIDTATITITNVAPTATFTAPATTFAGFPFSLALTSPHDPSTADTSAGFSYAFDCGGGSGFGAIGSSSSASCPTTDVGTRSVRGKIQDRDGGATTYTGTVQVVVTFDSLCALTRSYARRAADADALCEKLAQAAAGDKETWLKAYRNQVDAKTGSGPGKSFTAAQGALLKQLSTRL